MSGSIQFEVPALPPSLNRIGSRGSRWAYIRAKRDWEGMLWPHLVAARLPSACAFIEASATMRFPTRHRRDADNFSWMLSKALGDTLVKRGYLADDTPEFYAFRGVAFEAERPGPARTTITLLYR